MLAHLHKIGLLFQRVFACSSAGLLIAIRTLQIYRITKMIRSQDHLEHYIAAVYASPSTQLLVVMIDK